MPWPSLHHRVSRSRADRFEACRPGPCAPGKPTPHQQEFSSWKPFALRLTCLATQPSIVPDHRVWRGSNCPAALALQRFRRPFFDDPAFRVPIAPPADRCQPGALTESPPEIFTSRPWATGDRFLAMREPWPSPRKLGTMQMTSPPDAGWRAPLGCSSSTPLDCRQLNRHARPVHDCRAVCRGPCRPRRRPGLEMALQALYDTARPA